MSLGEKRVLKLIVNSSITYLSVIVVAELVYGFKNGSHYQKNMESLSKFMGQQEVQSLNVDLETADFYASLKTGLKKKGKPIPENDVWIAAHTMQVNGTLLTFDKHFKSVEGLKLIFLE